MNSQTTKERYYTRYAPRLAAFAAEVGSEINAAGVPEPHLPLVGEHYGTTATPKVAIIGRDTKYWGDMPTFLRAAEADPRTALDRHEKEFHEFKFTEWNYQYGRTFWATLLKLLAGLHGIQDWKALRRREHPGILRSFLWAETNSVEHFTSTACENGADYGAWRKLKDASERHFDSVGLLLDTFQPDIVIVLSRQAPSSYWDRDLRWNPIRERLQLARDEAGCGTWIFHTDHPGFLSQNQHYDAVLAAIVERARSGC